MWTASRSRHPAARSASSPELRVLSVAAWAVVACAEPPFAPVPIPLGEASPEIARIDVGAVARDVPAGGQLVVVATARDAAGRPVAGGSITWTSTDAGVLTVSAEGVVAGVTPGTAAVVAQLGAVQSDPFSLNVVAAQGTASVTLSRQSLTLGVGTSFDLAIDARTSNGDPVAAGDITWQTTDDAIATVADGIVSGQALGVAVISAHLADGSSAASAVTVVDSIFHEIRWREPTVAISGDQGVSARFAVVAIDARSQSRLGVPVTPESARLVLDNGSSADVVPALSMQGSLDTAAVAEGRYQLTARAVVQGVAVDSEPRALDVRHSRAVSGWQFFTPVDNTATTVFAVTFGAADEPFVVYGGVQNSARVRRFDSSGSGSWADLATSTFTDACAAMGTTTSLVNHMAWEPSEDDECGDPSLDDEVPARQGTWRTLAVAEAHLLPDANGDLVLAVGEATLDRGADPSDPSAIPLPDYWRDVRVRRFSGGAWSDLDGSVGTDRLHDCGSPRLFADGATQEVNVVFACTDVVAVTSHLQLWRWDEGDNMWRQRGSSSAAATGMLVVHGAHVTADGVIVLSRRDGAVGQVWRFADGEGWSDVEVTPAFTASAQDSGGQLVALGAQRLGEVRAFAGGGIGSWIGLGPGLNSSANIWAAGGVLAAGANGSLGVSWLEGRDDENTDLYAAVFNTSESRWQRVGQALESAIDVRVRNATAAIDDQGRLVVAWVENGNGTFGPLRVARYQP